MHKKVQTILLSICFLIKGQIGLSNSDLNPNELKTINLNMTQVMGEKTLCSQGEKDQSGLKSIQCSTKKGASISINLAEALEVYFSKQKKMIIEKDILEKKQKIVSDFLKEYSGFLVSDLKSDNIKLNLNPQNPSVIIRGGRDISGLLSIGFMYKNNEEILHNEKKLISFDMSIKIQIKVKKDSPEYKIMSSILNSSINQGNLINNLKILPVFGRFIEDFFDLMLEESISDTLDQKTLQGFYRVKSPDFDKLVEMGHGKPESLNGRGMAYFMSLGFLFHFKEDKFSLILDKDLMKDTLGLEREETEKPSSQPVYSGTWRIKERKLALTLINPQDISEKKEISFNLLFDKKEDSLKIEGVLMPSPFAKSSVFSLEKFSR